MNFRALIKNKDKSMDFIVVDGSKIEATNYSTSGVRKSDLNYINGVLSKLFYNDNCEYADTVSGYEIYYDRETKIYHFLKNKQEDLELLIRYNGIDGMRYIKNKTAARVMSIISILGLSIVIGLSRVPEPYVDSPKTNPSYDYKLEQAINRYSQIDINNLDQYDALDYKGALKYIQEGFLDGHSKEVLSNEELLQDMFSYYKGTLLEYSAVNKFKGLHILIYNPNEDIGLGTDGYYSILYPNEINISSKMLNTGFYDSTLEHEYMHLFQAEGIRYNYLLEAGAELSGAEYYNRSIDSYLFSIMNLKLLMDVIGPKPVIDLLYRGDDDEFLKIVRTNFSSEKSARFLALLDTNSNDLSNINVDLHNEVRELICDLYKAIYKQEINEDKDIMYSILYDDNKIQDNSKYFNIRKMEDVEQYTIKAKIQKLLDNGFIKLQKYVVAKKDVMSIEEYDQLLKDNNNILTPCNNFMITHKLYGIISQDKKLFYLFDKPLEQGEFTYKDGQVIYDSTMVTGRNITIDDAYRKGYIGMQVLAKFSEETFDEDGEWIYIDTEQRFTSNNPNVTIPNSYNNQYEKIIINVNRPGLKERFKDQYQELCQLIAFNKNAGNKSLS